jgi:hypothetical protein
LAFLDEEEKWKIFALTFYSITRICKQCFEFAHNNMAPYFRVSSYMPIY